MRQILIVLGFAVVGTFLGFMGGRQYCRDLLNSGQIYDEAKSIPKDIADGSRYGNAGAAWGLCAGTSSGSVVVVGLSIWRRIQTKPR